MSGISKILNDSSGYRETIGTDTSQKIRDKLREHTLYFTYSDISFQNYAGTGYARLVQNEYLKRKFVAIPAALIAGVVKTTYHLAITIFYGIPKLCLGSRKELQVNAYRILRDFEEAFGWIVTLFNDKRGTYIVQSSLYEKRCYKKFLQFKEIEKIRIEEASKASRSTDPINTDSDDEQTSNETNKNNSSNSVADDSQSKTIDGVTIPHYNDADKLSLLDFYKMNAEKRGETIAKFHLQESIDFLGGTETFFKKLEKADPDELENMFLHSLLFEKKYPKIRVILLSDEEFKKITFEDLSQYSLHQIESIYKRFQKSKFPPSNHPTQQNPLKYPIIDLQVLTGKELNTLLPKLPPRFCELITDDKKIQALDLSQADKNQAFSLCKSMNRERFALLSQKQVQDILSKISWTQLALVSDAQLQKIDFTNFKNGQDLQYLFINDDDQDIKYVKKRIALLSKTQLEMILPQLLSLFILRSKRTKEMLVTTVQLQALDLKKLNEQQLNDLLFFDGNKSRFDLLFEPQKKIVRDKLGKESEFQNL